MFSVNSVTKLPVITGKGFEPATSCVQDQDATIAPARHIWETGSLNRAQFIYIRFPEFAEINESSALFRKNSNVSCMSQGQNCQRKHCPHIR